MAGSIKIKNNINSELSITHVDDKPAKSIVGSDIAVAVDTINDFPLDASDGDTVIVRDLDRGGTFIYDSSKVAEHNDGTNFNGWIRQYSGDVNVKWFGVDDAGLVDCSNILINIISNFRTIYFPDGIYLLSNKIGKLPYFTTLRGQSMSNTRFRVTANEGSSSESEALIVLTENCKIENFSFEYPNQSVTNADFALQGILPYPPAIMTGDNVADSCQFIIINNINLGIAYIGIQGYKTPGIVINNVIGNPLKTGVYIINAQETIKISKINFNKNTLKYFFNIELESDILRWVLNNGTAFRIGRSDFGSFDEIFALGYFYGIHFISDHPSVTGSANNMTISKFGLDLCNNPIYIQNAQDNINFIGGTITSDLSTTGKNIIGQLGTTFIAFFTNCHFYHYSQPILNTGSNVSMIGCKIREWNNNNVSGVSAIQATTSGIHINISSGSNVTFPSAITNTTSRLVFDSGYSIKVSIDSCYIKDFPIANTIVQGNTSTVKIRNCFTTNDNLYLTNGKTLRVSSNLESTNNSVMYGDVRMLELPTADPLVIGTLWNNAGVVTVSAG